MTSPDGRRHYATYFRIPLPWRRTRAWRVPDALARYGHGITAFSNTMNCSEASWAEGKLRDRQGWGTGRHWRHVLKQVLLRILMSPPVRLAIRILAHTPLRRFILSG